MEKNLHILLLALPVFVFILFFVWRKFKSSVIVYLQKCHKQDRAPLLPTFITMHYLDPTAKDASLPPETVQPAHKMQRTLSGASSSFDSNPEPEARVLPEILEEYEHYIRSGGQSDFNEWASRKYAGISVPHVDLPKSLYLQRTKRSSAPIRDLLHSSNPLQSENIALVETAVARLKNFKVERKRERARPATVQPPSERPLQKESPKLIQTVQSSMDVDNPRSHNDREQLSAVEEAEPVITNCVVRSQRIEGIEIEISQHQGFDIPVFPVSLPCGVTKNIGSYALLMEIVLLSHIYNTPISCSAYMLCLSSEKRQICSQLGKHVFAQTIGQFRNSKNTKVSPRIVAHKVLKLRPLLRQVVIDFLIVRKAWCSNLDMVMWLGSNDNHKSFYDGYCMMEASSGNVPTFMPSLNVNDLQRAVIVMKKYLIAPNSLMNDDEYFLLRRIVEMGMEVCNNYSTIHRISSKDRAYIRIAHGDLVNRSLQFCEAWDDIIEMLSVQAAEKKVVSMQQIYSIIILMESSKCESFHDRFFIRYAESLAHAFENDHTVNQISRSLQYQQLDRWEGVSSFRKYYETLVDPVTQNHFPQVKMSSRSPCVEAFGFVGTFFAQLSVNGSFECKWFVPNDDQFVAAHSLITAEIDHISLYRPDVTRKLLMDELLKRTINEKIADALITVCTRFLPWTAAALLIIRAHPEEMKLQSTDGIEAVATSQAPIQSYESGSVFDTFVGKTNGAPLS